MDSNDCSIYAVALALYAWFLMHTVDCSEATIIWFQSLKRPTPQLSYSSFVFIWKTVHSLSTAGNSYHLLQLNGVDVCFFVYCCVILLNSLWLVSITKFHSVLASLVVSLFQVAASTALLALHITQLNWFCTLLFIPFTLWSIFLVYYCLNVLATNPTFYKKLQ